MEKIILVKPDLSYADEIIKYKEESLKESPLINGSAGLNRFSSIEDWLEELKKRSSEATVPEGLVPSSTYLGVREKDNYIVGMIDIRHYLNEFLKQFGGNIGYSVRKNERNKGYAKQMLKLALEKCKDLKMKKVLITCDEDNIASEKVILSAGAKFEDIRSLEGKNKKRFWLDLQ
ncbi:acetyltransferase [Fusobacterium animalis ATCC 51191]|uniref:Acetyltransferase n=1 Tax=Fusobacterium animalis ATCC 51191 TaxID=997347 RepID=F9ENM8_9FUSO|nr:acetyltransferase [Fusobacterium animalis ATCC 51191]